MMTNVNQDLGSDFDINQFTLIPDTARASKDDIIKIWKESIAEFYHPPLNLPIIIYKPNDLMPFGIYQDGWQVKFNLAYIPGETILPDDLVLYWFKIAVIYHEIKHYLYFPYDDEQTLMCMKSALKVFKHCHHAELYSNIVIFTFLADLLVDTNLLLSIGEDIIWATRVWFQFCVELIGAENITPISLVRMRTYEIYWKVDLGAPKPLKQEYEDIAVKLACVLSSVSSFSRITESFAQILLPLLEQMTNTSQSNQSSVQNDKMDNNNTRSADKRINLSSSSSSKSDNTGNTSRESCNMNRSNIQGTTNTNHSQNKESKTRTQSSTGGRKTGQQQQAGNNSKQTKTKAQIRNISPDFLLLVKDDPTTIKSRTKVSNDGMIAQASKKKAILESCMEIAENIKEFAKLIQTFEITDTDEDVLRYWLRGKSYSLINYESTTFKPSGESKQYVTDWTFGDPIGELDIQKSYQTYPLLIPPFTKKWKFGDGAFGQINPSVRDLIIVIDSSGSMDFTMTKTDNLDGKFYYAMLSSFAALYAAIKKEAMFSVVNFSSNVIATGWLSPHNQSDIIYAENTIMRHQNASTILPHNEILNLVKKNQNKCFIIIFSDSEIWNLDASIPCLKTITEQGHIIDLFLIRNTFISYKPDTQYMEKLKEVCSSIHEVTTPSDLVGLVISDVRSVY